MLWSLGGQTEVMYRSYMYSTITILIHHSHHTPGDKLQQHFAATEPSSFVYRSGNLLQQKIVCVLKNVCEDLCLCYIVLLPSQVAQIVSDLIFLRHVTSTKFCCRDKDFHKNSPVQTKRFVTVMCRCNMVIQLVL